MNEVKINSIVMINDTRSNVAHSFGKMKVIVVKLYCRFSLRDHQRSMNSRSFVYACVAGIVVPTGYLFGYDRRGEANPITRNTYLQRVTLGYTNRHSTSADNLIPIEIHGSG